MPYIMSIDPGDTSGWALWSGLMEPLSEGQANLDMMIDLLDQYGPGLETIIYEDFIGYRKRVGSMTGSRFVASQVIGAIKAAARRYDIELVRQPAHILPIAAMHSGREQPKNHAVSHKVDAYNHGYYFGVKEGLLKTALQIATEQGNL